MPTLRPTKPRDIFNLYLTCLNPRIQVTNYRTSEQPVHELSEGEKQKINFLPFFLNPVTYSATENGFASLRWGSQNQSFLLIYLAFFKHTA
jgi:hypothetical protein